MLGFHAFLGCDDLDSCEAWCPLVVGICLIYSPDYSGVTGFWGDRRQICKVSFSSDPIKGTYTLSTRFISVEGNLTHNACVRSWLPVSVLWRPLPLSVLCSLEESHGAQPAHAFPGPIFASLLARTVLSSASHSSRLIFSVFERFSPIEFAIFISSKEKRIPASLPSFNQDIYFLTIPLSIWEICVSIGTVPHQCNEVLNHFPFKYCSFPPSAVIPTPPVPDLSAVASRPWESRSPQDTGWYTPRNSPPRPWELRLPQDTGWCTPRNSPQEC